MVTSKRFNAERIAKESDTHVTVWLQLDSHRSSQVPALPERNYEAGRAIEAPSSRKPLPTPAGATQAYQSLLLAQVTFSDKAFCIIFTISTQCLFPVAITM